MDTQTLLNIALIILGFAMIMLVGWLVALLRTQHKEQIDIAREYMSAVRDLAPDFVVKELADMARGGVQYLDAAALARVESTVSPEDDRLYGEFRQAVIKAWDNIATENNLPKSGANDPQ